MTHITAVSGVPGSIGRRMGFRVPLQREGSNWAHKESCRYEVLTDGQLFPKEEPKGVCSCCKKAIGVLQAVSMCSCVSMKIQQSMSNAHPSMLIWASVKAVGVMKEVKWRVKPKTSLTCDMSPLQAHFSAPSNVRRKLMSAPLSRELRTKYTVRAHLRPRWCMDLFTIPHLKLLLHSGMKGPHRVSGDCAGRSCASQEG